MTAEQSIRNIERLMDAVNAATEFKRPGGYYTDPRIPLGHVHITHFPVPYMDETEEFTGRVLSEGNLFIRIDMGSGESATFHKRDCIITRGTGK